jgi:hypothetical protein
MPERDDLYVDSTYFIAENALSQRKVLANTEIKPRGSFAPRNAKEKGNKYLR